MGLGCVASCNKFGDRIIGAANICRIHLNLLTVLIKMIHHRLEGGPLWPFLTLEQ